MKIVAAKAKNGKHAVKIKANSQPYKKPTTKPPITVDKVYIKVGIFSPIAP